MNNIDLSVLSAEEIISLKLRSLYKRYGYSCFKMSKFEEYDLYGKNKDFLISDSVITFTDTNGKLMALKPDVTLSIVKNSPAEPAGVTRLYYNENVYRISESTRRYKELMQVGLECMGPITEKEVCEVAKLAAESLKVISEDSVLTVSDLKIRQAALKNAGAGEREISAAISAKNAGAVEKLCGACGVDKQAEKLLTYLALAGGSCAAVTEGLKNVTSDIEILAAADALDKVCRAAEETGVTVRADFSLTGDINYYNGVVFKGYVKGVPAGILSGGQYDGLMAKMNKKSGAVGFAVYADLLERVGARGADNGKE